MWLSCLLYSFCSNAKLAKLTVAFELAGTDGETRSGITIITKSIFNISNFGTRRNIGFINPPAGGLIYAVAFPASPISAINPDGEIIISEFEISERVLRA